MFIYLTLNIQTQGCFVLNDNFYLEADCSLKSASVSVGFCHPTDQRDQGESSEKEGHSI